MLQTNPYWTSYHPHAATFLSAVDSMYFRNGVAAATAAGLPVARPVIPRVFMPGMPQNVSPLPPPAH
nr:hypothetical protein BaRGS_032515 [Batillaria attramentaria]